LRLVPQQAALSLHRLCTIELILVTLDLESLLLLSFDIHEYLCRSSLIDKWSRSWLHLRARWRVFHSPHTKAVLDGVPRFWSTVGHECKTGAERMLHRPRLCSRWYVCLSGG
jgi:hypothetical protein